VEKRLTKTNPASILGGNRSGHRFELMITLRTTFRRLLAAAGAEAASGLVARAAFVLFVFLCVATSPGVGQFLIAAVGPITEEHLCLREQLLSGASTRVEQSQQTTETREALPLARFPGAASRRPLTAVVEGHRLANGLCAPLRL
jgi:hypothetical protein